MTYGVLTEVCDPVEQPGYRINGTTVEDFVTPAGLAWRQDQEGSAPLPQTPPRAPYLAAPPHDHHRSPGRTHITYQDRRDRRPRSHATHPLKPRK
jgi:hypothetical protein